MLTQYYNRLTEYFEGSFDFTRPFIFNGQTFDAMASFHCHVDKYVLVQRAQLWAMDSHEYCLMNTYDRTLTKEDFDSLTQVLTDYMEPHFVRKDEKDAPKDHMYSYLTIFIVTDHAPDPEVIKRVKRYRFTKYYHFYVRGYSEAQIVLVDTSSRTIYTNRAGRCKKKLCKQVFKDLDSKISESGN